MKKIIIKKSEFVLRRTINELEIDEVEYNKLVSGEIAIEGVLIFNGMGKLLAEDIDLSTSRVNHYNWKPFQYNNKTLKSWYELLPQIINSEKFDATFIKKNGEERNIVCEFEATHHIDKNVLTVYDLAKCDYRSINMDTLSKVVIDNTVYTLRDGKKLNA